MKINKGFTLIELLAVIVILAIIALIITPIITGVIKKAKDSADLRSAEAYVKAGENYFAKASTSGGTLDSNVIDDLEVSSKPATGNVTVYSDGQVEMAIIINNKCYKKVGTESIRNIEISDDIENCQIYNKRNYAFLKNNAFNNLPSQYKPINTINKVDNIPTTYVYSADLTDASIDNNTSIMAYITGDSTNGYDVSLVSSKPIHAPLTADFLFSKIDLVGDVNLNWLNTYFTTSMISMFTQTGYNNMTSLTLGDNFNTSNVTNMYEMFSDVGYKKMTTLNLGNNFNTINVTNMQYMFESAGYTSMIALDLGDKFNTENVTTMDSMFQNASYIAMKSFNIGDNFNAKSATNMHDMFTQTGYTAMTSLDLGDNFNAASATNLFYMFQNTGSNAMTTLNLGKNFNLASATESSKMFYYTGGKSLQALYLGDNFNVNKITNMSYMFYALVNNSHNFTIFDFGNNFDTSSATDMSGMFQNLGEKGMKTLILNSKFNTSNVTNMRAMFSYTGESSLETLDLGSHFDTSKVTNMSYMFTYAGHNTLTTVNLGPAFKNISTTDDIFNGMGKENACTIKVSSDIFYDSTHFKQNKDSSTTIANTRCTIVSTY